MAYSYLADWDNVCASIASRASPYTLFCLTARALPDALELAVVVVDVKHVVRKTVSRYGIGKTYIIQCRAPYAMSHTDLVHGKVPPSPELKAALQASTEKILVIILHGMDASVSDRNELRKLMAERGVLDNNSHFPRPLRCAAQLDTFATWQFGVVRISKGVAVVQAPLRCPRNISSGSLRVERMAKTQTPPPVPTSEDIKTRQRMRRSAEKASTLPPASSRFVRVDENLLCSAEEQVVRGVRPTASNEELLVIARREAEAGLAATERCLQIAGNTVKSASHTAEALKTQSVQMQRIQDQLDDVQVSMKDNNKLIKSISWLSNFSPFGRIKGVGRKPKHRKVPESTLINRTDRMAQRADDRNERARQELGLASGNGGPNSALASAPSSVSAVNQLPEQYMKPGGEGEAIKVAVRKQDANLDALSGTLAELKGIAEDIGEELDRQDVAVHNLKEDVRYTAARTQVDVRRVKRLLHWGKDATRSHSLDVEMQLVAMMTKTDDSHATTGDATVGCALPVDRRVPRSCTRTTPLPYTSLTSWLHINGHVATGRTGRCDMCWCQTSPGQPVSSVICDSWCQAMRQKPSSTHKTSSRAQVRTCFGCQRAACSGTVHDNVGPPVTYKLP
eukprot:jgi/Mesvir1/23776/Mv10600-RA.1